MSRVESLSVVMLAVGMLTAVDTSRGSCGSKRDIDMLNRLDIHSRPPNDSRC